MNSVPSVVQDALEEIEDQHEATERSGLYVHQVTGVPEGVVEGGQLRTVCGVRQLSNEHGGCVRGESDTETDEETTRQN